MQILKRGAEAILYLDSEKNLVKERIKKSYRLPEIDLKLRAERTRAEARLINEAGRAGVSVPKIFFVDEAGAKIVMEFLSGERLKEIFNSELPLKEKEKLAEKIGESIGKLHSHNLVHGDLTTSNLILHDRQNLKDSASPQNSQNFAGGKIFFIDFGLGFQSSRAEDFATDLSVLKEALKSTHFKDLNSLWEQIISGYKKTFPEAEKVFKALENIELRGRYIERAG
ncbi:MAG TPA: KEOPS complex kinase/ATPase Bud32 [archaeon]|nr:KEOPS complex kinase/ATPase Bud32 [archaeon]